MAGANIEVSNAKRFGFTAWAGEMSAPPYTVYAIKPVEIAFVRWPPDWVAYFSPRYGTIPLVGVAREPVAARNDLLTQAAKVLIEDLGSESPHPLAVQLSKLFELAVAEEA